MGEVSKAPGRRDVGSVVRMRWDGLIQGKRPTYVSDSLVLPSPAM